MCLRDTKTKPHTHIWWAIVKTPGVQYIDLQAMTKSRNCTDFLIIAMFTTHCHIKLCFTSMSITHVWFTARIWASKIHVDALFWLFLALVRNTVVKFSLRVIMLNKIFKDLNCNVDHQVNLFLMFLESLCLFIKLFFCVVLFLVWF